MKKPKPAPAPTPLEMAQEIIEAQAAERAAYRAYIDGIDKPGAGERYSEWNRVRENYIARLSTLSPQVATAYVSLHARNVAPTGATALTVGEMESYQALRDDVRRKLRNNTDAQVTAARWFRLADVLDEADATHRAYASLYARNLELTGDPFGKQLTKVEAERDALRKQLKDLEESNQAWAKGVEERAEAKLQDVAAENAQLRERVEALEKALESAGLVEADICPHCQWPNPHPVATHCDACDSPLPTAPTEKGGEAK